MKCFNCGREIADGSSFCGYCGAAVRPDVPEKRERHGCVTVWLWLIIISGAISVFNTFKDDNMAIMGLWFTVLEFVLVGLNIYGAFQLLSWKKVGFKMIVGTAIAQILIGLVVALQTGIEYGMGESVLMFLILTLVALLSPAILYAVLQIKHNGVSCWSQLED